MSNEIIINGVKYIQVLPKPPKIEQSQEAVDKPKQQETKPINIGFWHRLKRFIVSVFHTIIGFAIISIICAILWLAGGSKYFKSIDQQKVEYNEKIIKKAMLENTKYDSVQIAKIHGQEMGESKYNAWISLRLRQIQGLIGGAEQDVTNYKCSEGIGNCPKEIQKVAAHVLPKVGLNVMHKSPFAQDNFLNQPPPPVVKIKQVSKPKTKQIDEIGKELGMRKILANYEGKK